MESVRSSSHEFIHVFLGRGHNGAQKIVLCAPFQTDFDEVECTLSLSGVALPPMKAKAQDPEVRNFVFEFHGLISGGNYSYRFTKKGERLDLGAGLLESNLRFTYWSTLDAYAETVLISCNGVYIFKDQNKKWDMWRRLETTIANSKNPPKLLILGGDQYYQDDTEKEFYEKLKGDVTPELRNQVKMAAIRRAWEQTSDPSYRRLMASIPSVAMCDDHDFTDGAGGRFFNEQGVFESSWLNYMSILVEVFEAFQTSRNPTPIISKTKSAYSFTLDLGESALIALDMRTEKNAGINKIMDEDHKNAVFAVIQALPHKNILILSPVVPARNSNQKEGWMAGIIEWLKKPKVKAKFEKWHLMFAWDYIVGMEDDMDDALTSKRAIGFFGELMKCLSTKALNDTTYTLLTGDIHTGGSIELFITVDKGTFPLGVLVSSPIGYDPMPDVVEGLLQEGMLIKKQNNDFKLIGINNQFVTARNFVFLRPSLLKTDAKDQAARIFIEGIQGSRSLPIGSWNPLEGETADSKLENSAAHATEKAAEDLTP
ncbi:hypothetical protein AZI87_17445 [Bdellovibrio bacteriovorus]|uniref:Uncharacterized protein n=1 Tax=Bdellovibrio bacteriovorus TaxID=959 RepID=A0A162FUB6_BDEBC|nr:alkaline phosphatase D family protein [Bdellovibrio bacteriovorus]KYG62309.1 hypothetical protein AZI87_17445 [Bdellovibrio bacteriovorus]